MRTRKRWYAYDRSEKSSFSRFGGSHPVQPVPLLPSPFVGRIYEQVEGARLLAEQRVLTITGLAGSGKTVLASAIAQQLTQEASWIEIKPALTDSVETFLWQLAAPLATKVPQTWETLHRIQQSNWSYPPLVRLQIILDGYASLSEDMIVSLDNIEHATQPALRSLIITLFEYVAHTRHSHITLLGIGRALPYKLRLYALPSLSGLQLESIKAWSEQIAVELSKDEINKLHAQTGGVPQALSYTFAALSDGDCLPSIDEVMSLQKIRAFVRYILEPLPLEAQRLIKTLITCSDIKTNLTFDLIPYLDVLEDCHIVTRMGDSIVVHPLIQSFISGYEDNKL